MEDNSIGPTLSRIGSESMRGGVHTGAGGTGMHSAVRTACWATDSVADLRPARLACGHETNNGKDTVTT